MGGQGEDGYTFSNKRYAVRTALLLAAASAALAGQLLLRGFFYVRLGCILIGFTGLALCGASSAALLPASTRGAGGFSGWLGATCTSPGAASTARGPGKHQARAGNEGCHTDARKRLLEFFQFHGSPLETMGPTLLDLDWLFRCLPLLLIRYTDNLENAIEGSSLLTFSRKAAKGSFNQRSRS